MSSKYYEVSKYCKHNYSNKQETFDYMWGQYRYFSIEEMESILVSDIMKNLGTRRNQTYNCSFKHLLNNKYGKIERSDVIKLETLGFAIREIDYKKERDEFMQKARDERKKEK